MNTFVVGYYALLIAGSCLAAFYQKRTPFLLLFSLTLASFIMGIIGGMSANSGTPYRYPFNIRFIKVKNGQRPGTR